MQYKLISWNVNGIRAIEKKGLLDWLYKEDPFLLAVQETKASPQQLSENLLSPKGYFSVWESAQQKGYSGVGVYSKEKPIDIKKGFGNARFDREGRILVLEYPHFILLNIYFPNGKKDAQRLKYKLDFYQEFIEYIKYLKKHRDKTIIVCGDVNTAHKEIDLARPKENSKVSGFLLEERLWLDKFVEAGLIDTFRAFNHLPDQYTWWDLKSGARKRNVGWRIDYFYIDQASLQNLKDAFIMPEVMGSDHCPVGITLKY